MFTVDVKQQQIHVRVHHKRSEKHGGEYEPSYLRGLISGFDRHLRRHKYGYVIISPEFADTMEAMRVKQKKP